MGGGALSQCVPAGLKRIRCKGLERGERQANEQRFLPMKNSVSFRQCRKDGRQVCSSSQVNDTAHSAAGSSSMVLNGHTFLLGGETPSL